MGRHRQCDNARNLKIHQMCLSLLESPAGQPICRCGFLFDSPAALKSDWAPDRLTPRLDVWFFCYMTEKAKNNDFKKINHLHRRSFCMAGPPVGLIIGSLCQVATDSSGINNGVWGSQNAKRFFLRSIWRMLKNPGCFWIGAKTEFRTIWSSIEVVFASLMRHRWLMRNSAWSHDFLIRWWHSDILQGPGENHNCTLASDFVAEEIDVTIWLSDRFQSKGSLSDKDYHPKEG